jgi:copper chaperone
VTVGTLDLDTVSRITMHALSSTTPKDLSMNQVFNVQGMTCGHCEKAVTTAIKLLDPQAEVRIDRRQNRVEVQTTQPREALAEAIREEGYQVAA